MRLLYFVFVFAGVGIVNGGFAGGGVGRGGGGGQSSGGGGGRGSGGSGAGGGWFAVGGGGLSAGCAERGDCPVETEPEAAIMLRDFLSDEERAAIIEQRRKDVARSKVFQYHRPRATPNSRFNTMENEQRKLIAAEAKHCKNMDCYRKVVKIVMG